MNSIRLVMIFAALQLAACAQQPRQGATVDAGDSTAAARAPAGRAVQTQANPPAAAPRQAPLPNFRLDRKTLYEFLIAETAINRGQYQLAAQAYLDLARTTRDPRVARRATEIAFYSRQITLAQEAATLWMQADPDSAQARQTLAVILVNASSLQDSRPHLEIWLTADKDAIPQAFLQVNTLLARHADKLAVLGVIQDLAQPYPKVPEAQLAVAQAAWNANQFDTALAAAQAAARLKPDWEVAALFQAQVLQRKSNAQAIEFLQRYIKSYPKARDVRLNYARLLVAEKRLSDARTEFQLLIKEFPDNADVAVTIALLSMQLNEFDAAEAQLKRVLDLGPKDPDTVRYYLGQVNEERKRFDAALEWYKSVGPGEQFIPAQARVAGMIAKQGKLAEAREYLQKVPADNNQQRVLLTQAEAQILRDSNDYRGAFDLLGQALEKNPNYPDLLYDYAMAAEKIDRLDVVETNLRKLIEIKPDHAHAYNALGYTLADRTDRLQEAQGLIEQALKLAPQDPFIMDSMGWVLYRMGNFKSSYDYLDRAYKTRPDPEIAAHLGEVLWAEGKREEAEKLWRAALKENPDNASLRTTIEKHLR